MKEGNKVETQKTIGQWADETFGRPETISSLVARAWDEMREMHGAVCEAKGRAAVAGECADVAIVLMRLAEFAGFDLQVEIERKMAVNRRREWVRDGNGTGRHVAAGGR